jgi:DNA-binding NtrC family response regulator
MARIVIIEDDEALRPMLVQMVIRLGHEAWAEANGRAGLKRVVEIKPDLVITDMVMPEKEGVETIMELRRTMPGIKIIAISGGGRVSSADYLLLAKKFGAFATLAKPFSREELKTVLDKALPPDPLKDPEPGKG